MVIFILLSLWVKNKQRNKNNEQTNKKEQAKNIMVKSDKYVAAARSYTWDLKIDHQFQRPQNTRMQSTQVIKNACSNLVMQTYFSSLFFSASNLASYVPFSRWSYQIRFTSASFKLINPLHFRFSHCFTNKLGQMKTTLLFYIHMYTQAKCHCGKA